MNLEGHEAADAWGDVNAGLRMQSAPPSPTGSCRGSVPSHSGLWAKPLPLTLVFHTILLQICLLCLRLIVLLIRGWGLAEPQGQVHDGETGQGLLHLSALKYLQAEQTPQGHQ